MANEYRGRLIVAPQIVGGADQILDVGGEAGIGEVALRRAKPGEVEAQHSDPFGRKTARDALGGKHVLRAGEAMSAQREGPYGTARQLKPRCQLAATAAGECRSDDGWHAHDSTFVAYVPGGSNNPEAV